MPIDQLRELAGDVRRLLNAGGTAAAGDSGLRRRAAALRALGREAPVLRRVADKVEQVVDAEPGRATPALLDLLLVVRQVQAGLASASAEGTLAPVTPSGPWVTNTPVRALFALTEGLRRSGLGAESR